jgi:hypothetical protein
MGFSLVCTDKSSGCDRSMTTIVQVEKFIVSLLFDVLEHSEKEAV